jgi:hypothetical protein
MGAQLAGALVVLAAEQPAELAQYVGHHDPAFTVRIYTHPLPSSHDPPGA